MKKKIAIISLSAVLSAGVISSVLLVNRQGKNSLALTREDPTEWTISFDANDLMSSTTYLSSYCITKTDQNHNDVLFYARNLKNRYFEAQDTYYLDFHGVDDEDPDAAGSFWNDDCINSIKSIKVQMMGSFLLEWGWEKDSSDKPIFLESDEVYGGNTDVTFDFDNTYPNYFKFTNLDYPERQLTKFVIKMKKECTPGVSPLFNLNGIKYKKSADHISVLGFAEDAFANVVLPATIDGLPVNEISNSAFENNKTIQSINLDNITSIGNYAFDKCSNLASIGDYSNVTSFGMYSFEDCDSLNLGLSFTASEVYFEFSCFSGCDGITSVRFEDGCNAVMGNASFRSMDSLTSIYLGDSVSSIDDFSYNKNLESITVSNDNESFYAADNVLYEVSGDKLVLIRMANNRPQTSYVMPANVKSMDSYSCDDAHTLESFTFNDLVTSIPFSAFGECPNLRTIDFGAVTSIEQYGFSGCAFTELVIPSAMRTIYSRAFCYCDDLVKVDFEEGCTKVCYEAFYYCENLQVAVLPTTLEDVGVDGGYSTTGDIFGGCTSLMAVCTRLTSGNYPNEEPDCFGGRTVLYHADAETLDGAHWHEVGSDNAPRLWTTTMTIQSNDEYDADGSWFAIWAWEKGQAGQFIYDHNAPVNHKYTFTIPTNVNCFIILRMKSGVDASTITGFPDNQFHNRSANLENILYANATIAGWNDGQGNLVVNWE